MYNKQEIDKLTLFIKTFDGINDKKKLEDLVKNEFSLVKDRSVYYGQNFAIRFCRSRNKKMANTILSLSALHKYDSVPFIVCNVTKEKNYLVLANTTFLKKISHSSKELRIDNIKGSFNGSDIMYEFASYENEPKTFDKLFAYHMGLSFDENLERLVESTNRIVGKVKKFYVTEMARENILSSTQRSIKFVQTEEYRDLNEDLDRRVTLVQGEIAIASLIDNVNLRGRIIEYLITDDGSTLKDTIIKALHSNSSIPEFKTKDGLGDYSKSYLEYDTETDIKTKVLFLDGNPKAYNIDKLLEFLSEEKSVYMLYLLGIDANKKIIATLCSALDKRIIQSTNIVHHWAGRNGRGVAQFIGHGLSEIIRSPGNEIDSNIAKQFLEGLINR